MTAALVRLNRRTFSSFRYRNYRLFFAGQTVSQVGSWMQRIALGWFVWQLTHSAFAVGVMALATFLPFTLFGLFAGVLADRLDARRTVIATQAGQLVTATALASIAIAGIAQPWMLYMIAFVNGCVLVLDVPSRQQLDVPDGRARGPAERDRAQLEPVQRVADPRPCRRRRASTASPAPACASSSMRSASSRCCSACSRCARATSSRWRSSSGRRSGAARARDSAYVLHQPKMLVILGLTVVLSTFAFNFNVTLPVLAGQTLHTNGQVYGILSAMFGAGALVGALAAASLGRASTRVLLLGSLVFTGSELLLAPVTTPWVAGSLLFVDRRRLHRLVGELEHVDAARRARPPARPDHRPLLLRLQRHRPARRAPRRVALRQGRDRAGLRRRRSRGPRRHRGRGAFGSSPNGGFASREGRN